jgi:hypothetical protein
MESWREIGLTVLGTIIILIVLRDVVHELFHPERSGSMSRGVMHALWRTLRGLARWRRSFIYRAGPAILIGVAATWVVLLLLGWALIYWPRLPNAFHPDPTLPSSATSGLLTALYVSLGAFTTLSASDLPPESAGLRILVTLESLVGPIVFTAWITWVLGIYPVLAERRAFARQVGVLRRAESDAERAVREPPQEAVAEVLRSLSEQVLSMSARLQQARVTYYFQNESHDATLVVQLPYVLALARAAETHGPAPAIRHHGTMLRSATEELLDDLGEQFLDLHDSPPEQVIAALAEDHLLTQPTSNR